MSTKDIMDRITRPGTKPGTRAPEPKPADSRPAETRVNQTVVRRRAGPQETPAPVPAPAPAAAAPRTIRRPGAPVAPPAPPVSAAPPAPTAIRRPAVVAPPEPERAPEPPPVVVAPPEVTPAPEPEVAAPEVVAPPAPVAEVPVVELAPEPPPAPAPSEPVPEPTLERAVIVDRPGGLPRLAGPPAPGRTPIGPRGGPILPGLSSAVVSLPAGYDPTDPTGARRRAREQAATGAPRWGGAGAAPGADRRGPTGPGPAGRGEPTDARGPRGRRTERSERVMQNMPGGRMKPSRKGGGAAVERPRPSVKKKLRIEHEMTVANLAHEMGVKAAELIKVLMSMGTPATVNQSLDFDTISVVAQELGHEVVNVGFDEAEHLIKDSEEDTSDLPVRPPVVTVMGHVDHGKTTLLDTIRKSKVAAGEAGGITQHIGAYQVKRGDRLITFIDTPGHAAFSAMRARGARATDIVILVVAADDGIMPQTVEAINHAKAAKVPIVVAINKMDKPGIQPERIKQGLMEHGLVPEEFGGDAIMVPVSALKGTGVDDLLDNVLIVAEVEDLRANPDRHAEGVVLEARLETGRGAVASLLVQTGTLKQGDTFVIGQTWGRVRAMSDDRGAKIKEAGPSMPVEIIGLQEMPVAGDEFVVVGSEKDARALVEHRQAQAKASAFAQRARLTVEDLYKGGSAEQVETLYCVLKADVSGSLEALRGALEGLEVSGSRLKLLHSGIGPVTESDVMLAAPNRALVIAFGVKADAKARQAADQYGVEVKRYEIIYNVLDDVKARMEGMLEPVYEEQEIGEAEVRALFKIPRIGVIAGSMVLEGKVIRNAAVKVFRDGKVVHEGKVTSLKRFKEDVREVEKGFECGIGVEGCDDLTEGDRIKVFTRIQVPRA